MIFRKKKLHFCLEIKTCDPLDYTMDHSKFIASEFISCSATAKSELHVYDETPNLVNFVLLSLTELYLQQIMQVSC